MVQCTWVDSATHVSHWESCHSIHDGLVPSAVSYLELHGTCMLSHSPSMKQKWRTNRIKGIIVWKLYCFLSRQQLLCLAGITICFGLFNEKEIIEYPWLASNLMLFEMVKTKKIKNNSEELAINTRNYFNSFLFTDCAMIMNLNLHSPVSLDTEVGVHLKKDWK